MPESTAGEPTVSRDVAAGGNWLITGGCGFIGTSLVQHLQERGRAGNIRVLDNLCVGTRQDLAEVTAYREVPASAVCSPPRGVELVVADVTEAAAATACCRGIDIVVHLAASTGVAPSVEDPRRDMQENVGGTFNLLEASRINAASKFIFASSGAPVGETDPPLDEEKPARPVSPYGASKLAGEGYCSAFFRSYGVKTIALRFGNVYGPRSKHKNSVVARFIKRALSNQPIEIYGDGDQTRDFIYIDDLVEAIVLAAGATIGGEVFQIATHRETTINELAARLAAIVEQEAGIKVQVLRGAARTGDVRRNYSDIAKARLKLGWEPRYDIDTGLARTLACFLEDQQAEAAASAAGK